MTRVIGQTYSRRVNYFTMSPHPLRDALHNYIYHTNEETGYVVAEAFIISKLKKDYGVILVQEADSDLWYVCNPESEEATLFKLEWG